MNRTDRRLKAKNKSRCSDRYFGVFYHNSRNCTNGNAYCKIHTIMRRGRILGPVSSFLICHFLYLCAICTWCTAFPIPAFGMRFETLPTHFNKSENPLKTISKSLHEQIWMRCRNKFPWTHVGESRQRVLKKQLFLAEKSNQCGRRIIKHLRENLVFEERAFVTLFAKTRHKR